MIPSRQWSTVGGMKESKGCNGPALFPPIHLMFYTSANSYPPCNNIEILFSEFYGRYLYDSVMFYSK